MKTNVFIGLSLLILTACIKEPDTLNTAETVSVDNLISGTEIVLGEN